MSVAVAAQAPLAIALDGVSKSFGSLEVLRAINLNVMRGEVLALVGASGSGKSTLLNILSGLLRPDAGSVSINGVDSTRFADWRAIAYMFQDDRLLPWRGTLDNVALGLEAQRIGKKERFERARAALELVGLSSFENAYPHELSGGMRSRVALARSLVVEPSILLMDEPFSKLDPQTRSQMHDEVLRIQAIKSTTVVFVTHDVEEAVVLANRVVVLAPRPGRVKQVTDNHLPRPRVATDPAVAEAIRTLRIDI